MICFRYVTGVVYNLQIIYPKMSILHNINLPFYLTYIIIYIYIYLLNLNMYLLI